MKTSVKPKLNPRKVFWQCGACSHAMFHLLDHAFDNLQPEEEMASNILAGGLARKGQQCGMLWGGALAIGIESFRLHQDNDKAIAQAMLASKRLIESFEKRSGAINCEDITHIDWENKWESNLYMLKTLSRGIIFSPCFNLMAKWAPEAIVAADEGLAEPVSFQKPCMSCATEVLKKMGATEEESITVAGLAGGIGLSGHACGALGAAIWYRTLQLGETEPHKKAELFHNPRAEKILSEFLKFTGSEMSCHDICQRKFSTIDEHSDYIKNRGCAELLEVIATA